MENKAKRMIIFLMIIIALVAGSIIGVIMYNRLKYPFCYKEYVFQYSAEYSLEPELVFAVINSESGFMANAESVKGAKGLMQIIPRTAISIARQLKYVDFDENDLFNPRQNIEFGCYYLSYLFDKYKDEEQVLFAYNAGEGTLINYLKDSGGGFNLENIEIKETKNYIKRVKKAKKYYKKLVNNFIFQNK